MLELLLLQLGFGIPFLILFIALTIFLFKNKKYLHGNYYTLLRFSCVVDIYTFIINSLLLHLLNFEEIVPIYSLLAKIPRIGWAYWLPTSSFHLFGLKIIFMSVHRLVVIVNPLEGDEKFQRFVFPSIILIPLISHIITLYVPLNNPRIIVLPYKTEWEMDMNTLYFKVTFPLSIIYIFIIGSLTVASFLLMHKHTNMTKTLRKLSIVSIITNLIQTCFTAIMFMQLLAYTTCPWLHFYLDYYIIPGTIGVACLWAPWIQVFFNKNIMDRMKILFSRTKADNMELR